MRGQAAKILGADDIRLVLAAALSKRYPARNRVIVLLSVKAGLRACEVARLRWRMVTGANGQIGTVIELPARAAKKGSGRRIPIHPELGDGLIELQRVSTDTSRRAGSVDFAVAASLIERDRN